MAKTLTIAGANYLPFFKTSTARIREMLRKTNVMNFEAVTLGIDDAPQEGAEIIFKDGDRFLFAGFITRVQPQENGKGDQFVYAVEASSYDHIFNNKIVRRAYSNMTLADIVADIFDDFVGSSYGFDLTNVQTGPTLDTVSFDHITVRKALEKLEKLTGYVWTVDYEKNLYFQTVVAEPAPESITDSSANVQEINIAYDTSQVRNSVIVIGNQDGVQSLDAVVQNFVGDDETRSWELDAAPSEVIYIKRNGVSEQFSLDVNERETDIFTYSFTGKSFRLTNLEPTPALGETIEISYYPRIPVVEQKVDASSVAFFSSLDGGDGIYEHTIKDPSIGSIAEAGARADQELEEYAMPLAEGRFVTRSGLLGQGSNSFANSITLGTLRNDFTGQVGYTFTVSQETVINQLGRLYITGNNQDHLVKLWNKDTTALITSATVKAVSPSDSHNFKWAVVSPVTLSPGVNYVIAVDEVNLGDNWKELWNATAFTDPRFTVTGSAYQFGLGNYPANQTLNSSAYATPAMRFGLSYFKPGQVLTVNMPTQNLDSDTAFLIQQVDTEIREGDMTEYIYTVRFGGKIVGIQEFLETLASEQGESETVAEDTQIITIELVNDAMEFDDSTTPTTLLQTPPFKYLSGSPQGKWNLAEWK